MAIPILTGAPAVTPNKYGGDPVAFDTAMQAWIAWEAIRSSQDPAFLAWIEANAEAIAADRATVDTQAPSINAVNAVLGNVTTVAGIAAHVTTVAGIAPNVTTVAGIAANVTAVAGAVAAVGTNAGNIAAINTNAANIVAIQGASANAATATDRSAAATASAAQAATARDQALAGLGAADQSVNLVQLAYGISAALDQAAMANKRVTDATSYLTQSGEATVTQAASTEMVRTYATVAVTLAKPYFDTAYQVEVECISAVPGVGFQGNVVVQSRATNGFVLAITGSATSAVLRWKTLHPNAK